MIVPRYTILETSIGPVISESRVTVFDVLHSQNLGLTPTEISMCHNLTPLQVRVALEYIEQHRATLEPELREIRQRLAEQEAHERALLAEREKLLGPPPMTAKRLAFDAIREQWRKGAGDAVRDDDGDSERL
ncbi:MAG TPA: hypothetical protein VER55_04975 [Ardenticatenaceae bacterium]|nr:hypothetical protein [Ardenticatenaceae bacterium]